MSIKKSILIPLLFLFLLPPASILVLGYQFQGQVIEGIPFAVEDQDNSTLSKSLVKTIEENDVFNIVFYAETDEDVEAGIKKGEIAAAIIIPKHFESDMMAGQNPQVMMIYDNVQLSAAGTAKGKISEILATLNVGSLAGSVQGALSLSSSQTTAVIQPIGIQTYLINPGKSNMIFSMMGSLMSMIQIAVFILGLEMSRKTDILRPHVSMGKGALCGFLGTISGVIVMIIGVTLFGVPFEGSKATAFLLAFLYLTSIASLGIFFRVVKKDKGSAIDMISIVMMMMLLSGYSYPLISMPAIMQTIAPFIPFSHYGMPLRDIMLMGYGIKEVLSDIHWNVGFIILLWGGFFVLSVFPSKPAFIENKDRLMKIKTMIKPNKDKNLVR